MKLDQGRRRVRQPDAVRLGRELRAPADGDRSRARRGRHAAVPARARDHRLRLRGRVLHRRPAGHRVRAARRARRRRPTAWSSSSACRLSTRRRSTTAAALLADGAIVGFVAKQFLAGDGIHYEPRWFKPWPAGELDTLERTRADGTLRKFPIGDLVFDVGDVRIGFEICEDAWVANRPGTDLALRGVDIICNPSASHFAFGKFEVRQRFVIEGSRAFGVAYLYANLLGNEAGRIIYDGGGLIASGGELLARGRRFSFHDVELATAVVDVDGNRREQARASAATARATTPRRCVIAHPVRVAAAPARGAAGPRALVGGPRARSSEEEFAPRGRARPVGLPAQEPRAGLRGLAVGRRGLRGVRGAGRAGGAAGVRRARTRWRQAAPAMVQPARRGDRPHGRQADQGRRLRGGRRAARVRLPADRELGPGHAAARPRRWPRRSARSFT